MSMWECMSVGGQARTRVWIFPVSRYNLVSFRELSPMLVDSCQHSSKLVISKLFPVLSEPDKVINSCFPNRLSSCSGHFVSFNLIGVIWRFCPLHDSC